MIVNDERLTADTMKEDIPWEQYGITQVFTAYDTEDGKECINNHPIDIMLCDIEMPGENGLALLRWVRENKKDIECVFLTCHAKFSYAQEAIGLGCQDYILIPAKYEDIGETILKVVNRLKEKREASRYHEYGKYMLKEQIKQDQEEKNIPEKTAGIITQSIMKNITNCELSVDMLAEEFHFHPVYLNRLFKKVKEENIPGDFYFFPGAIWVFTYSKRGVNIIVEKVLPMTVRLIYCLVIKITAQVFSGPGGYFCVLESCFSCM